MSTPTPIPARLVTCRYLNRHADQCTGEAVQPDAEVLLCTRHLAAAIEFLRASGVRL